jgi:phosphoketolase
VRFPRPKAVYSGRSAGEECIIPQIAATFVVFAEWRGNNMKLQSASEHPHGLSESDYDSLVTKNKHIIFGFHGYLWLIHRLTYRRTNRNLHVRGYKEEGTITTAFDMRVQNDLDRFHLVQDVVDSPAAVGYQGCVPEADGSGQAHRAQALH